MTWHSPAQGHPQFMKLHPVFSMERLRFNSDVTGNFFLSALWFSLPWLFILIYHHMWEVCKYKWYGHKFFSSNSCIPPLLLVKLLMILSLPDDAVPTAQVIEVRTYRWRADKDLKGSTCSLLAYLRILF